MHAGYSCNESPHVDRTPAPLPRYSDLPNTLATDKSLRFETGNGCSGQTLANSDAANVKFNLIDQIEHLSNDRIVGVKYVSLAEEYLADHFPTFPVLPGVMMLEAMTQAAGWLLHHRSGFAKSMAVLKEARNVKYGQFVAPGNFLRVDVEFAKDTAAGASFKAVGSVNDTQALHAKLELAYFNLGDKQPELASLDPKLIEHTRQRWSVLQAGTVTI